ncbi:OmpA family protein [Acidiphilium sp. AL]|uniref:OmpA family protein n=1 Tax=Acidiphilium sp. AL TaxID=2871704 RepID=UPI0021CB72C2|nr:OmpA family protein [Acidiphilium sp. AL]
MTRKSWLFATVANLVFAAAAAGALMGGTAAAQTATQAVTGPYVSLGAGYNILSGETIKPLDGTQAVAGTTDYHQVFHGGFTGEAAVGYGFGNGLRVEVEGDYFRNTLYKLDQGSAQVRAGGAERKFGAMVNALYDIPLGLPVTPFVGAGIGYQFIDWTNMGYNNGTTGLLFNNRQGGFAYQAIAGISMPVPSVPGLDITAQYRFMGISSGRQYYGYATGPGGTVAGFFKAGPDYNNAVLLGLRYQLFQPAPMAAAPIPTPVAAPAPAPARTYLVFFNWDKANLTPRAKQIVGEAAQASRTTQVTRLNVNGYTDTSGSPAYNMKLSYRRADNVAAQLVADGVAKQDIVIKGYGETHLLVPTGPGVREPQNRRVEIILH